MLNKELKVRSHALLILAKITFTDNKIITDDLITRGVIKRLEEFVRLFPSTQSSIARNIILALSNLMVSAKGNTELVCISSICKYVVGQFASSDKVVTNY